MSEPKPFASLGPTLLARKGGARPAMRPQLAPMSALGGAPRTEPGAHDLEDLGWNDMGTHDAPSETAREAQVVPLTPEQTGARADVRANAQAATRRAAHAPAVPEVLRQRRAAAAEVAKAAPRANAVPLPAAPPPGEAASARRTRGKALEAGRRAAFTLRLDAQRHLMLRLASTVQNRSAQQLVTAALDEYLAGIPDLETLAAQVKRDRHDR